MATPDLPELLELQRLIDADHGIHLQPALLGEVDDGQRSYPLLAVALGNPAPQKPAIGIFGGVHGLERIGTEVVLAFLTSLLARLRWDELLERQLEQLRMVFLPVVNPVGMAAGRRANGRGVDLMRNAPVDAEDRAAPLLGGQRIGSWLPWYRGEAGAAMEAESAALCRLVEDELLGRPFALAIDCHSGFGTRDRIWFPYAHSRRPIPHLAEMHALGALLDETQPQHRYLFEPQSRQYLTHGDLWDHLYLRACAECSGMFLPLTLEMGSWLWVRKNPRQLFSRHGIFNPLIDHRRQRVLRRHVQWLDFMARAAASHARWLPGEDARTHHRRAALEIWHATTA